MRKRSHNKRLYINIAILCFGIEFCLTWVKRALTYLYLRKKLDFTFLDYTIYNMTWSGLAILSQFLLIPLISRRLKVRDTLISLSDMLTSILYCLILANVTQTVVLYIACSIAFLDCTSFSIIRSIITKLIGPEETGKVLSVVEVTGVLMPLVGSPILGFLYRSTVSFAPETTFYVAAGLYGVILILMMIVHCGGINDNTGEQQTEQGRSREIQVEGDPEPLL